MAADDAAPVTDYLHLAGCDWIFCIEPRESITESLQTSLFEWAALRSYDDMNGEAGSRAFSVRVREQVGKEWLEATLPETRLVPRNWARWRGRVPASEASAIALEGELLRFVFP